jgi:hypothetical protein
MSFLDVQELATVAAQGDLGRLLALWCSDGDALLGAIDAALGACLVGFVVSSAVKKR